jgi:hypothetical protein
MISHLSQGSAAFSMGFALGIRATILRREKHPLVADQVRNKTARIVCNWVDVFANAQPAG